MGTLKDTVGETGAARKKLKLNKETVKDLSVKEGSARAVGGGAAPESNLFCASEKFFKTKCV